MRRIILVLLGLAVLALVFLTVSRLNPKQTSTDGASSSSASTSADPGSDQPPLLTRNVSYEGVIEELGVAIDEEGTHKLVQADGSFVLLESTDGNLNLNVYLGKRVEVKGSTQPTPAGIGTLMRVEEITILDGSASSSSESTTVTTLCGGIAGLPCPVGMRCIDDPSDSCDPLSGGADCSGVCAPDTSETASSSSSLTAASTAAARASAPALPSSASASLTPPADRSTSSAGKPPSSPSSASISTSSSSSSSSTSISSSVSSSVQTSSSLSSSEVSSQYLAEMSKQNYALDTLWAKKYCTAHIAFCIPVHKNWVFKSFGATTSNLWHVEFGFYLAELAELGQGTVVLNLVPGTTQSIGISDGMIRTQGDDVVGFKDWKDNTHFELTANAKLQSAVSYMLTHITDYSPGD